MALIDTLSPLPTRISFEVKCRSENVTSNGNLVHIIQQLLDIPIAVAYHLNTNVGFHCVVISFPYFYLGKLDSPLTNSVMQLKQYTVFGNGDSDIFYIHEWKRFLIDLDNITNI